MKKLLVVYEKAINDTNRDKYIESIQKEIPTADVVDVNNYCGTQDYDALLALEPLSQNWEGIMKWTLSSKNFLDIEGAYTNKLTLTAEAIIRTIREKVGFLLDNKTILIVNQSNVLGKPLAKRLIELGANVISINSKYQRLENILSLTDVDIIVSATGNPEFKIEKFLTRNIPVKIDLSNDLEDDNKITRITTVKVLKWRLDEWLR
ncbi:hypothetical protein KQI68_07095 [Peptoniphilus sp. MSJ-1]|uniref:Tetrahydrofolate dehydrogenase/cyclohydrolase NAD(P)-binding domain-containing protein n=1 Tax=Peptoniphilus ovalis TaxID=2841503 RepID=A0ABS6FHW7_9FIRM|nr:hypothetical protein [Peptoniphilus ovalis]MBU5669604.1 hypothetical protein [Peptoniphilus ovalis]